MVLSADTGSGRRGRHLGLTREQWIVLASIALLTGLAAVYLVTFAAGMGPAASAPSQGMAGMGDMAMAPSGAAQSGRGYGLLAAMWAVMMAGLMLPSATPMILLYAAVQRRRSGSPLLATGVFLGAYLLVWGGFALAAAGLQQILADRALISPSMQLASRRGAGAVLILAGVYELSPLKQACLRHCRGPVAFVAGHWRPGLAGGLRMGVEHGLFCLGCCCALMLLLFVGGVMSFAWIVGLAALVLLQKLAPFGTRGAAALTSLTGAVAVIAGGLALIGVWR
jgi:predicted metal-binding membrane protein